MSLGLVFRVVPDDETMCFVIGWAETNNVRYDTRVVGGRLEIGMSAYHWRKAEWAGAV